MSSLRRTFQRFDERIIRFLSRYGMTCLRVCLAVVFIWFGTLKIIGMSPVADLVAQAMPFIPAWFFVPFLGVWELVIGLGLMVGKNMRFTLLLFLVQQLGTFIVLFKMPDLAYQNGNILLLSTIGEFVVKNLVLVSAGLVLGGDLEHRRKN